MQGDHRTDSKKSKKTKKAKTPVLEEKKVSGPQQSELSPKEKARLRKIEERDRKEAEMREAARQSRIQSSQ